MSTLSGVWNGVSVQKALINAEIVSEERFTTDGNCRWYYLNLGGKLISLGRDSHFADLLQMSIVRNARSWESKI